MSSAATFPHGYAPHIPTITLDHPWRWLKAGWHAYRDLVADEA